METGVHVPFETKRDRFAPKLNREHRLKLQYYVSEHCLHIQQTSTDTLGIHLRVMSLDS